MCVCCQGEEAWDLGDNGNLWQHTFWKGVPSTLTHRMKGGCWRLASWHSGRIQLASRRGIYIATSTLVWTHTQTQGTNVSWSTTYLYCVWHTLVFALLPSPSTFYSADHDSGNWLHNQWRKWEVEKPKWSDRTRVVEVYCLISCVFAERQGQIQPWPHPHTPLPAPSRQNLASFQTSGRAMVCSILFFTPFHIECGFSFSREK